MGYGWDTPDGSVDVAADGSQTFTGYTDGPSDGSWMGSIGTSANTTNIDSGTISSSIDPWIQIDQLGSFAEQVNYNISAFNEKVLPDLLNKTDSEIGNLASAARTGQDEAGGSIFDFLKKGYNSIDEQAKKGMWELFKGAALGYQNTQRDKYYSASAKASMMNAQTNADTLQNKKDMQGSAAAAWQNVPKPGLINYYKPVQMQPINQRITGG